MPKAGSGNRSAILAHAACFAWGVPAQKTYVNEDVLSGGSACRNPVEYVACEVLPCGEAINREMDRAQEWCHHVQGWSIPARPVFRSAPESAEYT